MNAKIKGTGNSDVHVGVTVFIETTGVTDQSAFAASIKEMLEKEIAIAKADFKMSEDFEEYNSREAAEIARAQRIYNAVKAELKQEHERQFNQWAMTYPEWQRLGRQVKSGTKGTKRADKQGQEALFFYDQTALSDNFLKNNVEAAMTLNCISREIYAKINKH